MKTKGCPVVEEKKYCLAALRSHSKDLAESIQLSFRQPINVLIFPSFIIFLFCKITFLTKLSRSCVILFID